MLKNENIKKFYLYFFKHNNKLFTYNASNHNLKDKLIIKNLQKISYEFWQNKSSQLSSMCGFEDIHKEDIKNTNNLLKDYINLENNKSVLEIGAGIGRITFNCLFDKFDYIDILDSNEEFLKKAKEFQELNFGDINTNFNLNNSKKIKNFYCEFLQNFKFNKSYDLIFVQWVLEYLSCEEIEEFFKLAKLNLNENGIMIVKENINIEAKNNKDNIIVIEEGSLIRPSEFYRNIFNNLNFKILKDEIVQFTRQDIYEVNCWVIKH